MDTLAGMATFVAVVEAGSFTQAAARLGLSKSAVSKAVTRLEDRLDARLLNRTTRQLSLTEVGRAFYERSARIVAEAEEAELAVTRLQATPRGTLRVNAPLSFGIRHLGPALTEFMAAYPELKVEIDFIDRRVDLIDEGYDLAVRIGRLTDSSLVARRLADIRVAVVAAPAYWRQNGRPSHPRELGQHNCLTYAYLPTPGEWHFEEDGKPLRVTVSGNLHANNGDVLNEAVCAGLGVARAPTFICGPDLAAGRLEQVLAAYEPAPDGVHAVYPHSRHLSAKVRAFIDFLAQRFGAVPYWDREWMGPKQDPPRDRGGLGRG